MAMQTISSGPRPLELPQVRDIALGDIPHVLRLGWRDFMLRPSAILYLVLIYPVIGTAVSYIALQADLVGLIYPLAAGFALVGPIAAVGVLELSRRHEAGEEVSLLDAFSVAKRPSFGAILLMALLLFAIFVAWIAVAQQILLATLGPFRPDDFGGFLAAALTTSEGLTMFVVGNAVGFAFAVVVLAISVVSLPMLVDGERNLAVAIATSVRAVARNPVPMAAWGLSVAALLAIGMVPVFAGLLIALPLLGHANWYLYRRVVARRD